MLAVILMALFYVSPRDVAKTWVWCMPLGQPRVPKVTRLDRLVRRPSYPVACPQLHSDSP